MKNRVLMTAVLAALFVLPLWAQDYVGMQQFRDAEWQMKLEHWKLMKDNISANILLDMDDYDVKYWNLKFDVTDLDGETITGDATMVSEALVDGITEIEYNLSDVMNVDSVKAGGQSVSFSHDDDILTITLDQTYNTGELITTEVYYNGSPQATGFGSFSWETHNGEPLVVTLSEPEGARDWWPCKDGPGDKADTSDIYMTVPDDLVATSNGLLISDTDNGDGTRTFHWHNSYPITTYLVCLNVSNYENFTDWYITDEGDSMPVTNYVYPEHYDDAVEDFNITPEAIGIFADLVGEYPFINEKYGHTIFHWGGAMEHQDNTSYGSMLISGNHYYDMITVHELAHMWFGDMISPEIWPDIWMNEGFATYMEALYVEVQDGYSSYVSYMTSSNSVSDPSGPIYDPEELFSGNTVYAKGSWVLHMLRGVMGDEDFLQGLNDYANDPEFMYADVTTREFQAFMEDYYEADLGWFFDEWVWGMNRPIYRYSWMSEDIGNGQYQIFLHISQVQSSPAPEVFTMPIRLYPTIDGTDTLITVWNDSEIQDYSFVLNGDPSVISFDKYHYILCSVSRQSYALNIVTTELPNPNTNYYYDETIEARGGESPYSYAIISGTLPDGLNLDGDTGAITGTPTLIGEYTFTVRCTDSDSDTDDQEYTLTVENAVGIDNEPTELPETFELIGNYPNPFNNTTSISFNLPSSGHVSLNIYNLLGQKVADLYDGQLTAGSHTFNWNGEDAPSGVYFYKLSTSTNSEVKKMTLLK